MNDEPDVYEPEFLLESERVIVLKVYNKAVRTHTDHLWIKVEPDSVVNWPIYVSTLTPNEYKYNKQCEYGRPLLNDRFHSFLAQLDNTIPVGFEIFFYDKNQNELGLAVMPSSLFEKTSIGSHLAEIKRDNGVVVGTILVEFVVIEPYKLGHRMPLNTDQQQKWKNSHTNRVVHCGHRGLGIGRRSDTHILENTIASFNASAKAGADMVELDVSLTKDSQVIVYHDLELVEQTSNLIIPIKDITYEQLISNNFQPVNHDLLSSETRRLKFVSVEDDPANQPFQKLSKVLTEVDMNCSINVEIKFPHQVKDHWVPHKPLEINYYVDTILEQIFAYVGSRDIMLTSFDADVCTCLRLKQTKYPVLFLTRGSRELLPRVKDLRMSMIEMAAYAAASVNLAGINAFATDVLVGDHRVEMVRSMDLLPWVWNGPLSEKEIEKLIEKKVCGVIYDKINEKIPYFKPQYKRSTIGLEMVDNRIIPKSPL